MQASNLPEQAFPNPATCLLFHLFIMSESERYDAVVFDLLTALIDSWTL